jgi:RHS repeat-associated protein
VPTAERTVYLGKLYQDELFATGTVKKHYFFGGKLAAMHDGGGVRFLRTDHLGSVNVVLNADGRVRSRLRYDPWGKQRYALKTCTPTGYRYTAQRFDDTLGLYDYQAHYYDSHIGRFISADVIVPGFACPRALYVRA